MSFSKIVLVFLIGLVVLGPQRLPIVIRKVVGWIRAMRSLANSVQNELAKEFKIQELPDSLDKIEQTSKDCPSAEFKAPVKKETKQTTNLTKRSYLCKRNDDEIHTVHNSLLTNLQDFHDGVTSVEAIHQVRTQTQATKSELILRGAVKPTQMSGSVKHGS